MATEREVVGENIEHRRELRVDQGATPGRAKANEEPVEEEQLARGRHQPLVRLHRVYPRQQVRVVAHLQDEMHFGPKSINAEPGRTAFVLSIIKAPESL